MSKSEKESGSQVREITNLLPLSRGWDSNVHFAYLEGMCTFGNYVRITISSCVFLCTCTDSEENKERRMEIKIKIKKKQSCRWKKKKS